MACVLLVGGVGWATKLVFCGAGVGKGIGDQSYTSLTPILSLVCTPPSLALTKDVSFIHVVVGVVVGSSSGCGYYLAHV